MSTPVTANLPYTVEQNEDSEFVVEDRASRRCWATQTWNPRASSSSEILKSGILDELEAAGIQENV